MPKPMSPCAECGADATDWRPMRLEDFERLGVRWEDLQDGIDAFTWIERYGVHVCGNGEHLVKTRTWQGGLGRP